MSIRCETPGRCKTHVGDTDNYIPPVLVEDVAFLAIQQQPCINFAIFSAQIFIRAAPA